MIYIIITTSINNKQGIKNNIHRRTRYIECINNLLQLINNDSNIKPIIVENNGQQKVLNNNEILQLLQQQQQTIQMLQNKVNEMQEKDETILKLQKKINELTEKISEIS